MEKQRKNKEELNYGRKLAEAPPGHEVAITGLSGTFPNSRNVKELQHNLYNKIDMISDDNRRWSLQHPEIPKRSGKIFDIEKFDAGYFGIHQRQAHSADPSIRIILEKVVEAIMDSGINPSELEGTKTGVFVGACVSQIEWFRPDCDHPQNFTITGNQKSIIANRISYHLKLNGPSFGTDTACSSSLFALEHAYRAIRNGNCDSAIVAVTNLCLHPFGTLQFARLGAISPDGCSKVFDTDGKGYVRAEATVAIFLQKRENAKRIYGRVVHAETNCDGYKEEGITFPSSFEQKQLYQKFYQDCNIDPKLLNYIEAHGTGTKVGDPEEVAAIDSVFCKDRKVPLLIGSVKSNIGHSEPSSGLCSLAKVIIGVENGLIPPNINFLKPREAIDGIIEGRLKVVTEPTPFENKRGLIDVVANPKKAEWLSITTPLTSVENFVNSQLAFKKFCKTLKDDSTIVEIGNQQIKIDKKNLNYLGLENVETKNSFVAILEILGSLFNCGHNPQIAELYPKVQFPVSRGTPMIAPLIKWNHNKDWYVIKFTSEHTVKSSEKIIKFSPKEDMWRWFTGHMIDGRNLLPATGYLFFVWETLSQVTGILINETNVVFENCKFLRATHLTTEYVTELNVAIQRSSGNFEVSQHDAAVCTGRVYFSKNSSECVSLPIPAIDDDQKSITMETKDIYKELRLRGYHYKGMFKGLKECDVAATKSLIQWKENWVCFMDNMLQMKILQGDTRSLYIPTDIKRVSIDAKKHLVYCQKFGESPDLPVYNFEDINVIKCGGIEIRGLTATSISRRKEKKEPVLEKYEFVPNCSQLKLKEAIRVNVQLILENLPILKVRMVEIIDEVTEENFEPLSIIIQEVLGDLPLVSPEITILSKRPLEIPNITVENQTLIPQSDWTLIVGTQLLQKTALLNQAIGAIQENGFLLSRESLTFETCEIPTIEILTIYTTETEKLVLFTKHLEPQPSTTIDVSKTTKEFEWLSTLQKSLKEEENVTLLAQNSPLSGILGLVNCLRKEFGNDSIKCVFIFGNAPPFDPSNPFYTKQLKKKFAINIYKNHQWGTYRHLVLEPPTEVESEHFFVNVAQRGDLSSLRWFEGPLTTKTILKSDEELVHVYYGALNFRDIMTATGRINSDVVTKDRTQQECVQGIEFSGRTSQGKRVFGMIPTGALFTLVAAEKQMIWELPEDFTLEDGATIPVVYSTVLGAFFVVTTIKKGNSILIHAGSGGVGQAAITVALHCGLTVYTTAGTQEKRDFLKNRFPQLNDHQIGNSRDTSFETMIFEQTKGRGVDFVLNSLAEEKLEASIRCLARGGKFLEIGKFDLVNNRNLQLLLMERDASFHGVMLDGMFLHEDKKSKWQKLIQNAMENGMIKPLVRTVFKRDEIEKAFRFMAGGKHVGKILIQIRKEEDEKILSPSPMLAKGIPRFNCDPDNVYIIAGGLGGFGLELADWLVLRGARKIILTSRNGLKTGYQFYRMRIWKSYGAIVNISTADITSKKGCETLLKNANNLGKVSAIFNLALVLKDAILENQTVTSFEESFEPKAFATKNLDELSRKLCPSLRDFVIFSSVSCGRGNAGQSNYGMANSVMERICEKRKEEGFPALAIQWGAIGDVGLIGDLQEPGSQVEVGGTLTQSITNCLKVLDQFLNQESPVVSSMVVAKKRRGGVGAVNIIDAVANLIGIRDIKTISQHSTLAELGMDSIGAVEIKQTLETEFDVFLTTMDMRSMTFTKLQEIQEEKRTGTGNRNKERSVAGFKIILRLMNDETTSQLPIIQMKSKSENLSKSPQVIFFPGLEGASKVLDRLVSNLAIDAKCVQFPYDRLEETIEDMAKNLLTIVEPLLTKSQPFNLIAYSFGSVIALEVVNLLEAKGYRGNLICIDGAPQMLKILLTEFLNNGSVAHFETSFLLQVLSVISTIEINSKISKKILKCGSFQERLAICEEIAPNNTSYTNQFFRKWSTSTFNRLNALNKYHPNYKIKSKVTLFKSQKATVSNLPEDFSLSKYCENFGDVKVFEGDHVTILDNVAMANAINESLGVVSLKENEHNDN